MCECVDVCGPSWNSAAINLKPDFAASYMYLAITLARLDDFDNACSAYDKVWCFGGCCITLLSRNSDDVTIIEHQ